MESQREALPCNLKGRKGCFHSWQGLRTASQLPAPTTVHLSPVTSPPLPLSSWSAALWTCSLLCIHSPSRALSGCVPRGEGEVGKGQPLRRATWSGHFFTGVEWDGSGVGGSLGEKAARGQPLQVTPAPRPASMEHQAGLSARASGTEPTPTHREVRRAGARGPAQGGWCPQPARPGLGL